MPAGSHYRLRMLEVDEALGLAVQAVQRRESPPLHRMPVSGALGRVLAEVVSSPADFPSNDYSAMDGYALRAQDVPAPGEVLSVVGECRAGHDAGELLEGCAVRIFTGARVPRGADTVVMQENVERVGDKVRFLELVRPGQNIRRAGEDLRLGDRVLEPGRPLTPFELALLCTVERTEVTVFARPRVSILCTGDELRPPGSTFFGGHLAESNSLALAALVAQAGGNPKRMPLVKDDAPALQSALRNAASGADLVLTVGGVSVGDHDLVRPVLEAMGAEIVFHKVKIKPGKPVLLARLGSTLVLGLPGNPSSAQVVMAVFGVPLLRALGGVFETKTPLRRACLAAPLRQKPGRTGYYRAVLRGSVVEVLDNQASGAVTSLAWGNCFAVVDSCESELPAGKEIDVLAYSDLR